MDPPNSPTPTQVDDAISHILNRAAEQWAPTNVQPMAKLPVTRIFESFHTSSYKWLRADLERLLNCSEPLQGTYANVQPMAKLPLTRIFESFHTSSYKWLRTAPKRLLNCSELLREALCRLLNGSELLQLLAEQLRAALKLPRAAPEQLLNCSELLRSSS